MCHKSSFSPDADQTRPTRAVGRSSTLWEFLTPVCSRRQRGAVVPTSRRGSDGPELAIPALFFVLIGFGLLDQITDLGDRTFQLIEQRPELIACDEHAVDAEALVALDQLGIVHRCAQ